MLRSCFETSEMTWLASGGCVFVILFIVVENICLEMGWKRARAARRRQLLSDMFDDGRSIGNFDGML